MDFRSDQFSFGSILYEMATGKRAFQKKTAVGHARGDPARGAGADRRRSTRRLPAPLRWIVERCLAKEPREPLRRRRAISPAISQRLRDHSRRRARRRSAPGRPHGDWSDAWRLRSPRWPSRRCGVLREGLSGRRRRRPADLSAADLPPGARRIRALLAGRPHDRLQRAWDGDPWQHLRDKAREPVLAEARSARRDAAIPSARGELAIVVGRAGDLWWRYRRDARDGAARRRRAPGARGPTCDPVRTGPRREGMLAVVSKRTRLEYPDRQGHRRGEPGSVPARLAREEIESRSSRPTRSRGRTLPGKERYRLARSSTGSSERSRGGRTGDEIWVTASRWAARRVVYGGRLSGKERVVLRTARSASASRTSSRWQGALLVRSQRLESWSRPTGETGRTGPDDARELRCHGALARRERRFSSIDRRQRCLTCARPDGSPPKKLGEGYRSELSPDGKWVVVVRPGPPLAARARPDGRRRGDAALERVRSRSTSGTTFDGPVTERVCSSARTKRVTRDRYLRPGRRRRRAATADAGGRRDGELVDLAGRSFRRSWSRTDGFWIYPADGGGAPRPAARTAADGLRLAELERRRPLRLRLECARAALPRLSGRVWPRAGASPGRRSCRRIRPGIWDGDLMLDARTASPTPTTAGDCLEDLYLVEGLK